MTRSTTLLSQKRHYGTYTNSIRRQRIREQIADKVDLRSTVLVYPNQALGNNYELNRKMVQHGILIRDGQAYHNLHLGHLVMLDRHALNKDKELVVEETVDQNIAVFHSSRTRFEGEVPKGAVSVPFEECEDLAGKFLDEFSWSERFFMNDGSLGSHAPCRNGVRFITNDVTTSNYVQKLLNSVSPNFQKFTPETVIYHAPDVHFPNAKGPAAFISLHRGEDIMELLTDEHLEQLTPEMREEALGTSRIQMILAGTQSLHTVRDALLASSSFFHTQTGGAAVNATTLVVDGKAVLVFNDSDVFGTGAMSQYLFSQDYSTLLLDGTVRTLNSARFQSAQKTSTKGDIQFGNNHIQSMNSLTPEIVAPKPSAIIHLKFNNKSKTATKKVDSIGANINTTSQLVSFQSPENQTALWNEITNDVPKFETTIKQVDNLEKEIRTILSQLK